MSCATSSPLLRGMPLHKGDRLGARHAIFVLAAALLGLQTAGVNAQAAPSDPRTLRAADFQLADFASERASKDVRHIANWAVDSKDNRGLPFVILDKTNGRVFVFDANGKIRGAAPALFGLARGDHSVPGIGDKPMSQIRPDERTTPAGRFVAEWGRNLNGEEIVWVDYDAALSLHRVRANNPKERRLERLATPSPADNRVSYGCINVPVNFFNTVVTPAFNGQYGIVYVLPETQPPAKIFGSYDVEDRMRSHPVSASRLRREPANSAIH